MNHAISVAPQGIPGLSIFTRGIRDWPLQPLICRSLWHVYGTAALSDRETGPVRSPRGRRIVETRATHPPAASSSTRTPAAPHTAARLAERMAPSGSDSGLTGTAQHALPRTRRVRALRDSGRGRRRDASGRDKGVEIRGVDAHVLAELGEGDAPLGDETPDEPRRRPETFGRLIDGEQRHRKIFLSRRGLLVCAAARA
jgi:hypothetical protein